MPRECVYLTADEVEQINQDVAGAGGGVRDRGGIEGVLGRPESSYLGEDLFPDLHEKAATLFHGFATTQYFFDGNKRTSFLCATTFLAENGWDWVPTLSSSDSARPSEQEADDIRSEALQTMIEAIADGQFSVQEIARYLRDHSRRLAPNLDELSRDELLVLKELLNTLLEAIHDDLFSDEEIDRIVRERVTPYEN